MIDQFDDASEAPAGSGSGSGGTNLISTEVPPERAFVLHPNPKVRRDEEGGPPLRSPDARLEEAVGLAHAINLEIVHSEVLNLQKVNAAQVLGPGQVHRLHDQLHDQEASLVVVDGVLTPVQQRNLERGLGAKVIDRTGLILEIFGARARTHEGRLQVDLAALSYQRSRLVRSWTHLERQRGGAGFMGGPGERQIEIDRRLIDDRIVRLKKELEDVRRTRDLHRQARRRVPYPIIAFVGYTNAGKSTLFNTITQATVFADDLLFATLDPTLRQVALGSGRKVMLSDTVGFISDLPTHLVAAFRATLEEVQEADLVVHVRDVSHPDTEAQYADVNQVLTDLDIDPTSDDARVVEAFNKLDKLSPDQRSVFEEEVARRDDAVLLSGLTGEGIQDLLQMVDRRINAARKTVSVTLSHQDGAAISWLYEQGEVLKRGDDETGTTLLVSLDPPELGRFPGLFPKATITNVDQPVATG